MNNKKVRTIMEKANQDAQVTICGEPAKKVSKVVIEFNDAEIGTLDVITICTGEGNEL